MTLTEAGKLGIGTAAPAEVLQVAGAVKVTGAITTDTGDSGAMGYQSSKFRFISWGGDTSTKGAYSFEGYSSNGSANATYLSITADGRGLSSFTAKAWVNMNGTGTPAITDSHNISSITDNATGEYRVVIANALTGNDTGAPVVSAMSGTAVGNDGRAASCSLNNSTGITVSVGSVTDFSGREDVDTISVVLFGD